MSTNFTRPRRIAVACAALALSAILFRPQIADGLVVRGDDFMYRNASEAAMNRYERALAIDNGNVAAADRIVFLGMEMRTRESLHRAIAVANAFLAAHPRAAEIRADRALCYLIQHRYDRATIDFERAAIAEHDPRYYVFAGWCASAIHHRNRARRLWKAALAIDPRYAPARTALERAP